MTNAPTSSSSGPSDSTREAAAEQSKAVASTAADQARGVADTASQQFSSVTDEAVGQARTVLDGATVELRDQLNGRLQDLATGARQASEELRALCEGRPGDAGRSRDVAERASRQIGHMAERADELGVEGVIEEVGDFARRRPVVFLAGAAAAGLLVGRLVRAGQQARSDDGQETGGRTLDSGPSGSAGEASPRGGASDLSPDPAGAPVPPSATSPDPVLSPAPAGSAAGWQGR